MRRKAAKGMQMTTTITPDEGRPVRVTLKADVGQYLEQLGRIAFETLIAGGLSPSEAADWLVKARQDPTSAEAMRFYPQRWVTGVFDHRDDLAEEPAEIEWVSPEILDELEAQLLEQKQRAEGWRRFFFGEAPGDASA